MEKEKSFAQGMKETLDKAGIPYKVVIIKMKYTEAVRKYVMKIEEAHKNAGKSKTKFKSQIKTAAIAKSSPNFFYLLFLVHCFF